MLFRRFPMHNEWWLIACLFLAPSFQKAHAQVSPAEITDPHLRQAQATYYPQMMALYRAINSAKFPLSFRLSRYIGLNPSQQAEKDARGLEFVEFKNRALFKVSGDYNVAYNAQLLTPNERASRAFSEVIAPILLLVAKEIPEDVACDGIGFEIAYHVRTRSRNSDYEGKENLVVVFDRADAFRFVRAGSDSERQDILSRSQIYLDGEKFALALGQKHPLDLQVADTVVPPPTDPTLRAGTDGSGGSTLVNPKLLLHLEPQTRVANTAPGVPADGHLTGNIAAPLIALAATATAADVDRAQSQFQAQLDVLASEGKAKFHFVDYAPPSFVLYHQQVLLQITMRNTLHFSQDSGSIYKRAAQSFDLFLAPQLKDLLDKTPADAVFNGYDITVLNQVRSDSVTSSEAVEYICPRVALRQFADAEITNQQLVDDSIILVNGVRIALNLQLVE